MWLLIQTNERGTKRKYVTSINYDRLIYYINKFNNVKKINDYYFISNDSEVIEFKIFLSDNLDGRLYNEYKQTNSRFN
jgi:hypothetical protein